MAYSRVNWQNSPSTSTPINATNLNKMDAAIKANDDKLLGSAVAGSMVVDGIRTKNMFGNYVIVYGWLDNNTLSIHNASNERLAFIPCKASTTYTVSRETTTTRFRVGDYTSIPTMTSTQTTYTPGGWVKNDSATTITYTTSSSAKYLIIEYANINNDSSTTISNCLASMMVEEGSTKTTYAPYQNLDGAITTGSGILDSTYVDSAEFNHWERSGNVVSYAFTIKAKGTWSTTTKFITGLPKPKTITRALGLIAYGNGSFFRFIINDDGSISNAYSVTAPSANQTVEGHITYITKD